MDAKKVNFIKKPKFIIGISLLIVIISICAFYFLFVPKISLNGDSLVKVVFGNKYEEEGCSAKYLGRDLSDKVWYEGEVDETKLGTYTVKCKVRKNKMTVTKERTVEVVDETKPVITLTGEEEVNICPNGSYAEEGFSAIDDYDGDITDKVETEINDEGVYYIATDSSDNKEEKLRKVNKVDTEAPVITLKGNTTYSIVLGSKYSEPGYTAIDNCEDDLTDKVAVSGSVDTSKTGTYELTYTVSDSYNNEASVKRTVKVYKKAEVSSSSGTPGTIYLTFDDGPSSSITPKLLDILKEKGVKATFFVINHSDSLDYLIKREYNEGHTVAIHSYSHNYATIYSSVDAYFNDLQKMSNKIERLIGVKSYIIRFPGGSSNTVSKKYSSGIMTTLTNEVLNRGYHYFDWNVGSGDSGDVSTKEGVYNNVIKGLSKNRANVILMHDFENNYKTLNAISDIIDYAKANGYEFKTIDMSTAMVRHKVNN